MSLNVFLWTFSISRRVILMQQFILWIMGLIKFNFFILFLLGAPFNEKCINVLVRIFLNIWENTLTGWSFLEGLTAWCQRHLSKKWLTWHISMMFMLVQVTGLSIWFARVHQVSKTMWRSELIQFLFFFFW